MKSYIRSAALIGSCLLGAGCQDSVAPQESTFFPEAQFLPADSTPLVTRVSGVTWDPEAFYSSVFYCGQCGIPAYLSEGIPLYLRSAVRGASVLAFDPMAAMPVGAPATSDGRGIWTLPSVPSRSTAPFFLFSTGQGVLPSEVIGPPFPPTPPTTYLPTFTLRPIRTVAGVCNSQEAVLIGRNGILEAVAKYLSVVKGKPTLATDFIDPTQYHGVTVVGMYAAGHPELRAPAGGMSVEASFGGGPDKVNYPVYYIDFAPPGAPPANLRSTRGFIVSDMAPSTSTGFAVVLVPTSSPRPPVVTYTLTDTVTSAAARRPWVFPPVSAPPATTVISFLLAPMHYQQPKVPIAADPPPTALCLPQ